MPRELPLTDGHVAIVDDEDFERVAGYRWHAARRRRADGTARVYGSRSEHVPGLRAPRAVLLHRFIMNAGPKRCVDHVDGNPLNNRRENLRLCSNAENSRNSRKQPNTASRFKGVRAMRSKWQAKIKVDRREVHLGTFAVEEDAARAYDHAAVQLHGAFARTNESLGLLSA